MFGIIDFEKGEIFAGSQVSPEVETFRMQSPFWHSSTKNCDLVVFEQHGFTQKKGKYDSLEGRKCLIHNIEVCKCGWEWNHHLDHIPVTLIPKPNCVRCEAPIAATTKHAKNSGNYCWKCTNEIKEKVRNTRKPFRISVTK